MPATGQAWTTLGKLKEQGFKNVWYQDKVNENVWWVRTEPQVSSIALATRKSEWYANG